MEVEELAESRSTVVLLVHGTVIYMTLLLSKMEETGQCTHLKIRKFCLCFKYNFRTSVF